MGEYGQKGLIMKPSRGKYAQLEAFCVSEEVIR